MSVAVAALGAEDDSCMAEGNSNRVIDVLAGIHARAGDSVLVSCTYETNPPNRAVRHRPAQPDGTPRRPVVALLPSPCLVPSGRSIDEATGGGPAPAASSRPVCCERSPGSIASNRGF